MEVFKTVNMLGPKYLHEMFVVHDSAYDIRNSVNIVMPNLILLSMVKTLSLILVQSYGLYLIMKPKEVINIMRLDDLLCYGLDQHVLVLTARIAH